MPTYEYRCPEGHEFEKFYRSIGGAPTEVTCPVCDKVAERLVSAGGGLVFKGSGFYITDYGKDGKKSQTPSAADSGSTGETPSKGEAKGEAPAKAETKAPESKAGQDAKPASSKPAEKPASTTKKKSGE
jgi:putative FmdB family regulatory protein